MDEQNRGAAVPGDRTHRTKIAVLIGTLEVGGAELDIVRNFPRLNRDEFEVVVVCFDERGSAGARARAAGDPGDGGGVPAGSPPVEPHRVCCVARPTPSASSAGSAAR